MKKLGKILVSLSIPVLLLNNIVYATSGEASSSEGFSTKYIFMGIAALVIIMLLFLGYKMDTKDDSAPSKPSKKAQKAAKAKKVKQQKVQEVYEEDNTKYEDDNINAEDLVEDSEYEEDYNDEAYNEEDYNEEYSDNSTYVDDDEDVLYSDLSESYSEEENVIKENEVEKDPEEAVGTMFDTSIIDNIDNDAEVPELENSTEEQPVEAMGAMFDTSIIDNIDNDVELPAIEEKIEEKPIVENSTPAFDETMIFNEPPITNNIVEVNPMDNLDNTNEIINDIESIDSVDNKIKDVKVEEEENSFIKELQNFKEPESTFEGFSVATPNVEKNVEEVGEKKTRKYTKVKKAEEKPEEMSINDDFLAQMEENLQKHNEEIEAKKAKRKNKTE